MRRRSGAVSRKRWQNRMEIKSEPFLRRLLLGLGVYNVNKIRTLGVGLRVTAARGKFLIGLYGGSDAAEHHGGGERCEQCMKPLFSRHFNCGATEACDVNGGVWLLYRARQTGGRLGERVEPSVICELFLRPRRA